jgi:2-hydroxychromene-2-carboxylate isomerase
VPEAVEPRFPVDVYFDYSSPFSYVGTALAERVFGDRARYHPMLLGAVFKHVGAPNVPMFAQNTAKRAFTTADMQRQAEQAGLPFSFPTRFPMNTVLPLRVTLLAGAHETAEGRRLVHRIYRAYWAEDRDISDPAVVAALCDELGYDGADLVKRANLPENKLALRAATDRAIEAGVFGAPTFVVHTDTGPELFWGADRIDLAARAAAGDERVLQYSAQQSTGASA